MPEPAFIDSVLSMIRLLHEKDGGATFQGLYEQFPSRLTDVRLALDALKDEGRIVMPQAQPDERVRIVPTQMLRRLPGAREQTMR